MLKKGVVMGARKGGKIKAVAYMLAGAAALLAASAERFGFDTGGFGAAYQCEGYFWYIRRDFGSFFRGLSVLI